MKYIALFVLICTSVAHTSDYTADTFPSHVKIAYYATDAEFYTNHKTAQFVIPITPNMTLLQLQSELRDHVDPRGDLISYIWRRPVSRHYRRYDPLSRIITNHEKHSEFENWYYFRSLPSPIPKPNTIR